ncbi:DUF6614 family protein [Synoicihabitans lomoniglobus]|uniref:Uncharacterized protein n=1 Tax=Synoicihabitans lomoniglobus TaxID=2909285 RepID=A0AAF0I1K5_9BACT|nr:hypothetical protein [Opitutaceae bacterium LMO-M01]WED65832.1 hypothetical protein PXH66_03090 [Opitutaceae bacterium LMO-M01]
MLHYPVWFDLKPGVEEASGLGTVREFLASLTQTEEANAFRLLRNTGERPRTPLPRYHALVEFTDQAALDIAMKAQATRGIFHGFHGAVVDVVSNFHVEIFDALDS